MASDGRVPQSANQGTAHRLGRLSAWLRNNVLARAWHTRLQGGLAGAVATQASVYPFLRPASHDGPLSREASPGLRPADFIIGELRPSSPTPSPIPTRGSTVPRSSTLICSPPSYQCPKSRCPSSSEESDSDFSLVGQKKRARMHSRPVLQLQLRRLTTSAAAQSAGTAAAPSTHRDISALPLHPTRSRR